VSRGRVRPQGPRKRNLNLGFVGCAADVGLPTSFFPTIKVDGVGSSHGGFSFEPPTVSRWLHAIAPNYTWMAEKTSRGRCYQSPPICVELKTIDTPLAFSVSPPRRQTAAFRRSRANREKLVGLVPMRDYFRALPHAEGTGFEGPTPKLSFWAYRECGFRGWLPGSGWSKFADPPAPWRKEGAAPQPGVARRRADPPNKGAPPPARANFPRGRVFFSPPPARRVRSETGSPRASWKTMPNAAPGVSAAVGFWVFANFDRWCRACGFYPPLSPQGPH